MQKTIKMPADDAEELAPLWRQVRLLQSPAIVRLTGCRIEQRSGAARVCLEYAAAPAGASSPVLALPAWWRMARGTAEALAEIHGRGLWVGSVSDAVRWDADGRPCLVGLGAAWTRFDPFSGHPSTRGRRDPRLQWRQRSDVSQATDLLLAACPELSASLRSRLADCGRTSTGGEELRRVLADLAAREMLRTLPASMHIALSGVAFLAGWLLTLP